jgi:hypothetical protein
MHDPAYKLKYDDFSNAVRNASAMRKKARIEVNSVYTTPVVFETPGGFYQVSFIIIRMILP